MEAPPRLAAAGTQEQHEGEEEKPAAGDPQPGCGPALPSHAGGRDRGRGWALLGDGPRPGPHARRGGTPGTCALGGADTWLLPLLRILTRPLASRGLARAANP